ncbi:MAG: helix-turn-helix domain-containing protein, partial [Armatimonadota bacterium]|nr:helix-turn-helix domain-containing protein [Armatimonadota bacterium]
MRTQERRERERQARREQILKAAEAVFSEKGFLNATTEEIAQRAEVAVGTLYLYFRSKEEMYVSLLFESLEIFPHKLEQIRALDVSPDEKLRALWDFLCAYYRDYPAYYRILTFLHNEGLQEAVSSEVIEEIKKRTGRNFRLAAQIVR